MQVLDEVDRVEDAVERAGHVGHDRAEGQRHEHRVPADEAQALGDLLPRIAGGEVRGGRGGSGLRISSQRDGRDDERDGVDEDRERRADQLHEAAAKPGPPISASDELVASLLLPSTTRSTPMSDGTYAG